MPKIHEGPLRADGRRFAIVASRFNEFMVDPLVKGALDALRRTGASEDEVEIFRCPGAFELPGLLRRVVDTGRFDGVVCLGVVIRGATPHFDLVVGEATGGIARVAAEGKVAIGNGLIACENMEQAIERAGSKAGNRGADAALVAVEMANLYASIGDSSGASSRSARSAGGR
jgi:6,7-dimethyl-8-ribityllumazine synthase